MAPRGALPSAPRPRTVRWVDANGHRRGSLLVVDDEPTIAEVVSRYLERAGYETRVAADGPAALELAGERPARPRRPRPDAARPRRARGDAAAARRRGPRDRVPIILLTARGRGVRPRRRAAARRRRLRRQAVLAGRARRARGRGAAPRRPGAASTSGAARASATLRIEPERGGRSCAARRPALTQREFDLLLFLARHPGRVFSRDAADGRGLAVLLLHRHLDGDRPHPPPAREDRARPRRAAARRRRCGASATGSQP